MTAAGLHSLFRHHRQTTSVTKANPHRFRHTFASNMVRAGISLPGLMQLLGHAHIQTTISSSLQSAQHVMEMFRRTLPEGSDRRLLDRLANRLTKIAAQIRKLNQPEE